MSSFLHRIKARFEDPSNFRGSRLMRVDAKDLLELINHFEQLDSLHRVQANKLHVSPEYNVHNVHNAITALFHESKQSSERVLNVVMRTLTKLSDEHHDMASYVAIYKSPE